MHHAYVSASQQTHSTCRMLRGESFRNVGEHDVDRNNVDTTAASFTSFNSEEGFGSPAGRRSKGRPNVFEMDDNDLKVHRLWIIIIITKCASTLHRMKVRREYGWAAYALALSGCFSNLCILCSDCMDNNDLKVHKLWIIISKCA